MQAPIRRRSVRVLHVISFLETDLYSSKFETSRAQVPANEMTDSKKNVKVAAVARRKIPKAVNAEVGSSTAPGTQRPLIVSLCSFS